MKYTKILAVLFVILVFILFFMNRPVRERACPLASSQTEPSVVECAALGGVVKDGKCTCPY